MAHLNRRITRAGTMLLIATAMATLPVSHSLLAQSGSFSPRLNTPRIAPLPEQGRTDAHRHMLASRPDYNIYKTLAHDPVL